MNHDHAKALRQDIANQEGPDGHGIMCDSRDLRAVLDELDALRVAAQALVDTLDALSPVFYDAEIGARARALEAALKAVGS